MPSGGGAVPSCLPLSNPPAIGLYGIAAIPSSLHSGSRSRSNACLVTLAAECHRAEAEARDTQTGPAEPDVLHGFAP